MSLVGVINFHKFGKGIYIDSVKCSIKVYVYAYD